MIRFHCVVNSLTSLFFLHVVLLFICVYLVISLSCVRCCFLWSSRPFFMNHEQVLLAPLLPTRFFLLLHIIHEPCVIIHALSSMGTSYVYVHINRVLRHFSLIKYHWQYYFVGPFSKIIYVGFIGIPYAMHICVSSK